MSNQTQGPASSGPEPHELEVDVTVLDRYVGAYRFGEFSVVTITREGKHLFVQAPDAPSRQLIALTESEFLTDTGRSHLRFANEQGPATSVVMYQGGIRIKAVRVDASTVAELQTKLATKIRSQQATPGSAAALRHILEGIETGKPQYEEMSSALAQTIRQQLPQLQAIAKMLGPFEAIEYRGVGNRGWDVYEVRRKNGSTQWRIALNSDGIVEGASALGDPRVFSDSDTKPATSPSQGTDKDTSPDPRSEAALRRMIDSIRNGNPNYDEMSPMLAQTIRQQFPQLQALGKQLGTLVSVDYKGSTTVRYDSFEVHREHGTSRCRIALDGNGIITMVNLMLTERGLSAGP